MNQKNLTDAIIAMEKAALEEWNKGNPSGFLAIYAGDINYFDPFQEKRLDGFETMQTFYEGLRGAVQVDQYEMIDPSVQLAGETAVLTYNLVSYSGNNVYRWNCTEVYRQQPDKQWKIIHNHWSFVRPVDMKE
jgi:ketosteroid isomerase-like protein